VAAEGAVAAGLPWGAAAGHARPEGDVRFPAAVVAVAHSLAGEDLPAECDHRGCLVPGLRLGEASLLFPEVGLPVVDPAGDIPADVLPWEGFRRR
jgi:hypothetical protein